MSSNFNQPANFPTQVNFRLSEETHKQLRDRIGEPSNDAQLPNGLSTYFRAMAELLLEDPELFQRVQERAQKLGRKPSHTQSASPTLKAH